MTEAQIRLALLGAIVAALVALNVQFYVTFGLQRTVNIGGEVGIYGPVSVQGEVTPRSPEPEPSPITGEMETPFEESLRSVLNDCKLGAFLGGPISEASSLELTCVSDRPRSNFTPPVPKALE